MECHAAYVATGIRTTRDVTLLPDVTKVGNRGCSNLLEHPPSLITTVFAAMSDLGLPWIEETGMNEPSTDIPAFPTERPFTHGVVGRTSHRLVRALLLNLFCAPCFPQANQNSSSIVSLKFVWFYLTRFFVASADSTPISPFQLHKGFSLLLGAS